MNIEDLCVLKNNETSEIKFFSCEYLAREFALRRNQDIFREKNPTNYDTDISDLDYPWDREPVKLGELE